MSLYSYIVLCQCHTAINHYNYRQTLSLPFFEISVVGVLSSSDYSVVPSLSAETRSDKIFQFSLAQRSKHTSVSHENRKSTVRRRCTYLLESNILFLTLALTHHLLMCWNEKHCQACRETTATTTLISAGTVLSS